jgi:hypothetical protein
MNGEGSECQPHHEGADHPRNLSRLGQTASRVKKRGLHDRQYIGPL